MKIIIIFQLWRSNWKKTANIKVLEETLSYDALTGNLIKVIFVGARAIPVLLSSKSAANSFDFGCVGWGLTSIFASVRGKEIYFLI